MSRTPQRPSPLRYGIGASGLWAEARGAGLDGLPSANCRRVPGREAGLQALIIPLAFALAATRIGATFLPVR
jgi:hypothetical protein